MRIPIVDKTNKTNVTITFLTFDLICHLYIIGYIVNMINNTYKNQYSPPFKSISTIDFPTLWGLFTNWDKKCLGIISIILNATYGITSLLTFFNKKFLYCPLYEKQKPEIKKNNGIWTLETNLNKARQYALSCKLIGYSIIECPNTTKKIANPFSASTS